MGAFDTLPSRDPEAVADLAAAALEQDPDDWRLTHVAAHLRDQHPQVAAGTWPDDNLYTAHEADHRDWNHDHTHPARHVDRVAGERARSSRWRSVQRAWEQARTLGGRVLATLRRTHAHQSDPTEQDPAQLFATFNPTVDIDPTDPAQRLWRERWEAELTEGAKVNLWRHEENHGPAEKRRGVIVVRARFAHLGDPGERFAQLNPDFGVLPDGRDPDQHRFAADREQALVLGTRAAEALRAHNHPDHDRRRRAVAGVAVQAKLRAAGYEPPTREEARRAAELTGTPAPQRPVLEQARGGPER
jgi:hypothetical protein